MKKFSKEAFLAAATGPGMRLDYHECACVDDLIQILNEIVASCFFLEKVIQQPDGCFLVLFRRHDLG